MREIFDRIITVTDRSKGKRLMKRSLLRAFSVIAALVLLMSAVPSAGALGENCATLGIEHTFGEWVEVTPAGCVDEGVRERVCTVCGEVETETIPAKGHNTLIETVYPTCTQNGYTKYYCPVCSYVHYRTTLRATGHNSGTWKVVKSATANAQGRKMRSCTVCGEVLESVSYSLNDAYVDISFSEAQDAGNGETEVTATVAIHNNPGLAALGFYLYYYDGLTVVSAENGALFSDALLEETAIDPSDDPAAKETFALSGDPTDDVLALCYYADTDSGDDVVSDGTILTVTFKFSSELTGKRKFGFAYNPSNVIDSDMNNADILFCSNEKDPGSNGPDIVIISGDVDGDGVVTLKDISALKAYIAGIAGLSEINQFNSDVDLDGAIGLRDISALKALIAG